jgi:hypothetical protein
MASIQIPSVDKIGNIEWHQCTAVTRHNPTPLLYEITTVSGRVVTVVDSKSLLVWSSFSSSCNENDEGKERGEWKEKLSSELRIGDLLPTTRFLPRLKGCEAALYQKSKQLNGRLFMEDYENGYFIGLLFMSQYKVSVHKEILYFMIHHEEKRNFFESWMMQKDLAFSYSAKIYSIQSPIFYQWFSENGFLKMLNNGNAWETKMGIPTDVILMHDSFIQGFLCLYWTLADTGEAGKNNTRIVEPDAQDLDTLLMMHARIQVKVDIVASIVNPANKVLQLQDDAYNSITSQVEKLSMFTSIYDTKRSEKHAGNKKTDVYSDAIKEIRVLPSDNKKVYDVTVT